MALAQKKDNLLKRIEVVYSSMNELETYYLRVLEISKNITAANVYPISSIIVSTTLFLLKLLLRNFKY